ncbi:uncharacterized protein LOC117159899 isoform X1 [Bombus vancouverensis nearcticus]|uniref:Uncharacterized protein LOC117214959 isoform X1 n=1 Tax=Bombus bifarius TaxID=103933 RepID=A0A6P8NSS5_9HYME|nr:uncharacterized protein LOC117159899 isoform X1 [Bombus vancouverensis nearcticus]XP_033317232.1 uncharacterized protein LOC117214959 isoform X1 [Bombus bifarius]
MEHHPAPMALHPEEDHLAPTEHLPTVVADHLRPMVHHQVAEDRLALMALLEAAAASAVDCRRAMAHHRVDHRYPLVTQHLFLEVVECPPAMARLLEAAVAADTQDHLPLTVHLAPVVAVSEVPVDILEAVVVTLEAEVATLEVETVDIPVVVATPAAVETVDTLAEVETEATPAEVETEVIPAEVETVAIPAEVETVAIPAVVATLEVAEVVTLEEAAVATLEEVVTEVIPEVVATPVAVVAVATPAAEVVKVTPATEVTNINRKKFSSRATTFDHVSPIINHHRTGQKNFNTSTSSMSRSRHNKLIPNVDLSQTNGTSADETKRKEAESEVILANLKSSPKYSGSALKV